MNDTKLPVTVLSGYLGVGNKKRLHFIKV